MTSQETVFAQNLRNSQSQKCQTQENSSLDVLTAGQKTPRPVSSLPVETEENHQDLSLIPVSTKQTLPRMISPSPDIFVSTSGSKNLTPEIVGRAAVKASKRGSSSKASQKKKLNCTIDGMFKNIEKRPKIGDFYLIASRANELGTPTSDNEVFWQNEEKTQASSQSNNSCRKS